MDDGRDVWVRHVESVELGDALAEERENLIYWARVPFECVDDVDEGVVCVRSNEHAVGAATLLVTEAPRL